MKKYMAIWCLYDPDNYRGHYIHRFEAENMEAAEQAVYKRIKECLFHGKFEYQITEITDAETTSYRLYDTKTNKRL